MTKKNKHKPKSISTRVQRFLSKLFPVFTIGTLGFILLFFLNPIVGFLSIPVISIVGYRHMAGGFIGAKNGNKNPSPPPPNSNRLPTPNSNRPTYNNGMKSQAKPSQQNTTASQVVKINLYGVDGRLISSQGAAPPVPISGPKSPRPPPPEKKVTPKPPPNPANMPPPVKAEEVLQVWENTLDAFIANNRHKFLNLAGSVMEQAIRHASMREFGKILPTAEAISALTKKNYFHYQRNHLLWLWSCRNDYAHEAKIMKTEVDKLSDEIMLQIFEMTRDIVSSAIHNV